MATQAIPPIDTATVPALSGVNAPVTEERDAERLEVIGHLPDDLHGVYLRNGPNPRFPPSAPTTTPSTATPWCTASGSTATPPATATASCKPPTCARRNRPATPSGAGCSRA